ncbi:MAG: type I 3-dehydroquinate dehydratase [Desulfosarcina sp.]|nr:type I 3-dehydroquinate dehydratase [Desulfobacterales bacterium]
MRLQSETKVTVRDKVIGGPDPLICLPLVASEKSELLNQAQELKQFDPDLLEWRIDAYDKVEDIGESLKVLKELREKIGNIPMIFTCRIDVEGGFKKISPDMRLNLIKTSIQSGHLDIVDVEMCNEPDFMAAVKETAKEFGTRLIFSYHNFNATPDEAFIHAKLTRAQEMGADIAKLAVMPKDYADVLTLLNATLKARTGAVKVPIVTMSMGPEGGVTRLVGGLFGSDITFAIGKKASAPGQIPIGELRQAMSVLYE